MLDQFEKKHPNVKYNIIRFHENLIMPLKQEQGPVQINTCTTCGEPCSKELCKACQIFALLEESPKKPLEMAVIQDEQQTCKVG